MDYISQSPTHCSKGNIQCVLQCTKFHHKKSNGLIFETNCSSIKQRFMKLEYGLQRKRGKNKHTCPMFDNDFLASSDQMKLCTTDYIFPIKQDNIFDYNPLCFVSSGMMLDDIIVNIFTESTKKSTTSHQKHFFFRFQDDEIQLYKGYMQEFTWKRKTLIQNGHCVRINTLKLKN